ncbi:hypothetical protein P389DRAFT_193919 [Cystobasidium minutum MCA 4210]|uniref:uncharacterized protein n=1 Tax=Cystobasidium minutum MCA 4210 TaxID=1397322 RepID=UPI0034CD0D8C|eukprot:jgi/Rhomi1/193919/gm1.2133_g
MVLTRELPQLPVELLEAHNDEIPIHNPARASNCIKQIHRLSIMLKQEAMLLHKIRYKQKNQHKSATWWRHISGSQRVAYRLLEQLEKGLVPHLPPSADDKQPVLSVQSLFAISESSLRISFLAEKTFSYHVKAAAAVQQLLRAALFMPIAMTLKALIARLHSIWTCVTEELHSFLLLIRVTLKKKPRLAQDLEGYIGSMPAQLRIFWKDAAPKSSKNAKSAAATVVQSASGSTSGTPSATPSRAQSPVLSKVQSKSKGKSSLSQSFQPETQQDMAVDSPPAAPVTIAKPENMPIAESKDDLMSEVAAKPKKVKKRKKAGAGDDIDAIFAGL